jgi:hypothetical protein
LLFENTKKGNDHVLSCVDDGSGVLLGCNTQAPTTARYVYAAAE